MHSDYVRRKHCNIYFSIFKVYIIINMSSSNLDIKKLVKYQSKLAGGEGDYMKQKLYNEKIVEYATKIKNKGIDISKILRGGGGKDQGPGQGYVPDPEDPALTQLKASFAAAKLKVALPEGSAKALSNAAEINKFAKTAQSEHDNLIKNFITEIKRLHLEKDSAEATLKKGHVDKIALLDAEIVTLKKDVAILKARPTTVAEDTIKIQTLTKQLEELNKLKNALQATHDKIVAQYDSYKAFAEQELASLIVQI